MHWEITFARRSLNITAILAVLMPVSLLADVVRDGTIGPDVSVQPTGPHFEITEELGERHGNNLFHSFQDFNLTSEQSATFTGGSSIENIISRVTGGSASNIDGLLSSTIPSADFYFMNPYGVVFGPNATVDVQGAFHTSTAGTLHFSNEDIFSADMAASSILSLAPPETFGFLGETAAPIEFNGSTIGNRNGLDTVLSAGTVQLNDGAKIIIDTDGLDSGGDIFIYAAERVILSGTDSHQGFPAGLFTHSFSEGDGGQIYVEAPVIELHDGATIGSMVAGIDDSGHIDFSTNASGNGGDISVIATERVTLSGLYTAGNINSASTVNTVTFGQGVGGSIVVQAPVIELEDGAFLAASTFGNGDGGELLVTATERISLSGTNGDGSGSLLGSYTTTSGKAGSVIITAPLIELHDGALISALTSGSGGGGGLFVTATELLTLSGTNDNGTGSGLQTFVAEDATANGSPLSVEAPMIKLHDGAFIQANTGGLSPSGTLRIAASEHITLSGTDDHGLGSRLEAVTLAQGDSLGIEIQTAAITLTDGAVIASNSVGTGNAGPITIVVEDSLQLNDLSTISSSASSASGGNIDIQVNRLLLLNDSDIATNVASGPGGGGDIVIDADAFVFNNSRITAQADTGNGGNIQISTRHVLTTPDSLIDASAGPAGVDGVVTINSQANDLDGELAHPATEFLDANALLHPGCESRAQGTPGSFTAARQQGLPLSPENLLLAYEAPVSAPTKPAPLEVSARSINITTRGAKLRGIALQQQIEGHYGASLDTLSSALAEQPHDIAATLGSAANAYLALGLADTALEHFTQAINAATENDHRLLATLYNNLGNFHMVRQDFGSASSAYRTSAQRARQAKDVSQEAKALSNRARAALAAGQLSRAVKLQQQARHVAEIVSANQDKAYILIHLANTAQQLSLAMPNDAHKYLATAYSDLRSAAMLSSDLGDDRTLSYALGNLGSVYQQQNRLTEALYLTRVAQQSAERANAPEAHYRWHWQTGQLLRAQSDPEGALQAYRQAVSILEASRPETLAQYRATHMHFRQAVAPVYLEFVDALLQHSDQTDEPTALLLEARATVEKLKAAELRDYFRDECITELEAKNTRLENVSSNAAIVYPIILPQRLELLVSLPDGLKRYPIPVDAATLTQATHEFRTLIESKGQGGQLHNTAQQLYDWLVHPYTEALEAAGIETLVFVPDGPLRAAPLAALHDGDDYLIRRFGVVVTPGLSLTDPQPLNRDNPRLLLAGISDPVQDFSALPYVSQELEQIQQLFGGRMLLNKQFTQPKLERALETPISIVHLASHAQFTDNADDSFLLTHNGRMSMEQLGEVFEMTRFREQPLELLVLSACQTAVGDDRAAMGLAGIGLKAGARSAIGTLWFISDKGTSKLMGDFYTKLKDPTLNKAQALQQAQQAMLDDDHFAHPYYWSPFLLLNNWL